MNTQFVNPIFALIIVATFLSLTSTMAIPTPRSKFVTTIADTSRLYHESKKLSKSYPVRAGQTLSISNRYGSITVTDWDKSEIGAEIRIEADGLSPQQAKDLVSEIEISEYTTLDTISVATQINSVKSAPVTYSGKGKSIQISYVIHLPHSTFLKIKNVFGKVDLNERRGTTALDCAYTDISANKIDSSSTVKMRFGSLTVNFLEAKTVEADMAELHIAHFSHSNASFKYCKLNIDNVAGSSSINLQHCPSVSLGTFAKDEGNLTVNASFSDIRCGNQAPLNVKFDVRTNNSMFDYDSTKIHLANSNMNPNSTYFQRSAYLHYYKGNYGSNARFLVQITANSGDVKFL